MLKKLLSIAAGIGLVFGLCTSAMSFDKEANIEALNITHTSYDTYIKLQVIGTALVASPERDAWHLVEGFYEMSGSGYVPLNGYVVTAAHVVEPNDALVATGSATAMWTHVFKRLSRTIILTNFGFGPVIAYVHYIDTDKDIAILRYNTPHPVFAPFTAKFTHEEPQPDFFIMPWDYEEGDAVAIVVRERDEDGARTSKVIVRTGKVLRWGPKHDNPDAQAWLSINDVTTDALVLPGDSGSAVFVFKNGVPIYVGVARASVGGSPDTRPDYKSYFAYFGLEYRYLIAMY
ncbi:MAG: S1 family peptidase [Candidatus Thorarchaeota archaeon]|jgi:hypothetical protein